MVCAGYGFDCVAGEAGAGAVVGGAAVVADERPDVGSNHKFISFGVYFPFCLKFEPPSCPQVLHEDL